MLVPRKPALAGVLVIAGLFAASANCEEAAAPPPSHALAGASSAPDAAHAPRPKALPDDKTTPHSLALAERRLDFKASVSTIHLTDGKGEPLADVVATAFLLDRAEASTRPVAFVFNGGPGAASAFLQLGALGPWRLPLIFTPSAAPIVQDNPDSWLEFTDLVFIDPPGTGWSRIVATGDEQRKRIWSVEGDIEVLAAAVRRWLAANERMASPKFIVGESYGGFRAPRLAETLATKEGVGVSGLVLISPALDFPTYFNDGASNPIESAARLPSFAAVAREAKGPVARADLADVEAYASGEFIVDFLRGLKDPAALARMSERISAITGLDSDLVAQLRGRVGVNAFLREFARAKAKILAPHDASLEAYDPEPEKYRSHWLDPGIEGLLAPLTSAAVDVYERRLEWKTDQRYELINFEVSKAWNWGHAPEKSNESASALRRVLALDPNMRVLIAHGLTDLVTPYYAAKLLLDQIPDFGPPGRVRLAVYPGGHMHYSRDESRKALRRDARELFERR